MSYTSPYDEFIFEDYTFNEDEGLLTLQYSFDEAIYFTEYVHFEPEHNYNRSAFKKAAFMAFVLAGISYYKSFPTKSVRFANHQLTAEQASFFSETYRSGLSQFMYENNVAPDDIAVFKATTAAADTPSDYAGNGVLALQSGGKDSLLLATLLQENHVYFTAWYMSQSAAYPTILETLDSILLTPIRDIDAGTLAVAQRDGALNGHVPITYINLAYGLVDGILHGYDTVLASIGREGEEPYDYIEDLAVRHQWSKTWQAEQSFSRYVHSIISPSLRIGSPLRGLSELKIAELFVEHCWEKYGHAFSSCNKANYTQGHDNSKLSWCGDCPKCANSFLLFAPFVPHDDLCEVFGSDLFKQASLVETFKGLLAIDEVVKPFECVGETAELRRAYQMAIANGYAALPFEVPDSNFDLNLTGPSQEWATSLLNQN